MSEALAIETVGLSRRYGSTWGLQECSIDVPEGRISALVGPNGARQDDAPETAHGTAAPDVGGGACARKGACAG